MVTGSIVCQTGSAVVNKQNLSFHRFALMVIKWHEVGGGPKALNAIAFTGQPYP